MYKPGDTLTIEVLRDGQTIELAVTWARARPTSTRSGSRSRRTPACSSTPSIGTPGLRTVTMTLSMRASRASTSRAIGSPMRLEQVVAVVLDLRAADLEDVRVAHRLGQVIARSRRAQVELVLDVQLDDLGIGTLRV